MGIKGRGKRRKPRPKKDKTPKRDVIMSFCRHNPKAQRHPKNRKAIRPNLRISLLSVKDEFIPPLFSFFPGRLFLFKKDKIFHDQYIHLRPHKATICVLWCADNGFSSNIETGIDHHRASGQIFKLFYHLIKIRFIIPVHSLDPCWIVKVGHCRDITSLGFESYQHIPFIFRWLWKTSFFMNIRH